MKYERVLSALFYFVVDILETVEPTSMEYGSTKYLV